MEPFKVHVLGCGSAKPTLRHHASAQAVEMRGRVFLMDCSEGAAEALAREIFQTTSRVYFPYTWRPLSGADRTDLLFRTGWEKTAATCICTG